MNYSHVASAYLQNRVASSTPEQLVPLLYEKLLAHLHRAAAQIEARDIEGKAESLQKAADIVFELLSSLNFEAGGELAARLAALYAFFANEIAEVGRSLDRDRLARVVDMISMLHQSWVQAAVLVQQGAALPDGGA